MPVAGVVTYVVVSGTGQYYGPFFDAEVAGDWAAAALDMPREFHWVIRPVQTPFPRPE